MTIETFLNKVDKFILNPLIILLFSLAFLYFIYGIVKFVNPATPEKDKIEARDSMFWGLIGMAIMFSVYGLVGFVLKTFGISGTTTISGQVIDPTSYINRGINGR